LKYSSDIPSAAFLETLSAGNHMLTAEFEDGSATAGFTVKAAENTLGS